MQNVSEPPRGMTGSSDRHHHKSKHRKEKHKHKEKDKRREDWKRNKEVGSDVESGEILGDNAEVPRDGPGHHRTSTQHEQLSDDRRTDPSVAHRAAGALPTADGDGSPALRRCAEPPAAGSSPAELAVEGDQVVTRKRDRSEADDFQHTAAAVGKAGSRGRKEARREAEAEEWRDEGRSRHRSSRDGGERPREQDSQRPRERERRPDEDAREAERLRDRERERGERVRDVLTVSERDDRRDCRDRDRGRDRDRELERERVRGRDKRPGGSQERPAGREGPDAGERRSSRERARSPRGRSEGAHRDEMRRRSRSRGRGGDRREHKQEDRHRGRRDRDRDRELEREREREKGGRQGRERRSPEAKSPELHEAAAMALEEEEDEEARIEREREERRRRQQAIMQRHAQQQAVTDTVVAPTASALAASAPASAAATPSRGPPRSPAPGPSDVAAAAAGGAGGLPHVASASALLRSAPGTPGRAGGAEPGGGDGDRTPEGECVSSSEASDANADGPVLDIFRPDPAAADDADSGAVAAAMAAAAEDAERERELQAAALLQRQALQEPGASTALVRLQAHNSSAGAQQLLEKKGLVPAAAAGRRASVATGAAGAAAGAAAAAAAAAADEDEDDMFAEKDDDDDMFAVDDSDAPVGQQAGAARAAPAGGAAQLHDSYDDAEGYYNFQIGEVLDGRYEVTEFKGKGVFSSVMRARDLGAGRGAPEVAIKVIRANDTMYKAAQTEQAILRKLCAADPDNRKHCIRLLRAFEFRRHMCLVFEAMDMNLRDLTKKYGRNKGLNVAAVGMYAAQLLVALRHLRKHAVLHADIKPDNILVNARRTKVKLCDFGSAMQAGDNEVTPYLVSRFYRAPEVILGCKYDYAMDMWSVGCVVYELFTGSILFPGRTNNEMVKLMMDVKGPFTKKMLRRCAFADRHFQLDEPSAPFISLEEDAVTKKPVRRMINVQTAKQPFSQLLGPALRSAKPEDRPQIQLLVDLLERMMALEPEKRIDTDAALRHPFVRAFLPRKHEHAHRQAGAREGSVPL